MIIHYLTLIFSFFMGFKINLNVLSLISYAVVSVILALLFMRNMKFKLGNIIVVSTLFYFINCGAAILELVNII